VANHSQAQEHLRAEMTDKEWNAMFAALKTIADAAHRVKRRRPSRRRSAGGGPRNPPLKGNESAVALPEPDDDNLDA
jgi:hypothetical protein